MRGKLLLAGFADLETSLFGLAAFERQSATWIARQREISRVYFAIGLTSSVLAGSMALLVILALPRAAVAPVADATLAPSRPVVVAAHSGAFTSPRAVPAVLHSADVDAPQVRAMRVAEPLPQVAAQAIDARQFGREALAPARGRTVRPATETGPAARGVVEPVRAPSIVVEAAPVPMALPEAPAKRPEGLLALGGPDRAMSDDTGSVRVLWWHLPALRAW